MPINNFKLFDENKANMMTDQEYNIAQQRLNGVQSGVASSQLQNKTLYQTALMCYALAQLMAANGYDANDADAVSTFVNNMSLSMVQKVVDKASSADLDAKTVGKWVDAAQLGALKESVSNDYLKLLGGTMLGDLVLNADPTQNLQAATKQYVDGRVYKILKEAYDSNYIEVDTSNIDLTKNLFLIISAAAPNLSTSSSGINFTINGSVVYSYEIRKGGRCSLVKWNTISKFSVFYNSFYNTFDPVSVEIPDKINSIKVGFTSSSYKGNFQILFG